MSAPLLPISAAATLPVTNANAARRLYELALAMQSCAKASA